MQICRQCICTYARFYNPVFSIGVVRWICHIFALDQQLPSTFVVYVSLFLTAVLIDDQQFAWPHQCIFPPLSVQLYHHFQHCTIAINKATLHLCGTLQVQVQYWHALKETMGRASEKFAARFDFNGHLILLANTSFPCSCTSSSLPFSGKK